MAWRTKKRWSVEVATTKPLPAKLHPKLIERDVLACLPQRENNLDTSINLTISGEF